MDISQVTLKPVLATALLKNVARSQRELSYEKGDLIEIQKDLGNGIVFGSNVSQGSTTGVVALRNIELNIQTQTLEAAQLEVEEMLLLRRDLEQTRKKRELMQIEVINMREAKAELLKEVNPIRYALRNVEELLRHLTQTDIELIEVNESVREVQNDWTNIMADINRLQMSVDDPELDPFRRLVLDRCDGLKKRVLALQAPASETMSSCKMLQVDLQNLTHALRGIPLLPRPSRSVSSTDHARTSSQTAFSAPQLFKETSNSSSAILNSPVVPQGTIVPRSGSLSSHAVSAPALHPHSEYDASLRSPISPELHDMSPSKFAQISSEMALDPRPEPDTMTSANKFAERTGILGSQRLRGSSPALFKDSVQARPSTSTPSSTGSGFILGTKPISTNLRKDSGKS